MNHNELMQHVTKGFNLKLKASQDVIKDTVDFIKEHDIAKKDWDNIDYCENDGCDNMELDENLVHSIYYDDKRVCPECIESI